MKSREEDADGPYVWTASGIKFRFLAPTVEMVSLKDITHHLSHIPRFTGVSSYSVLSHSLNVYRIVADQTRELGVRLQALLHDAAEYIVNDLAGPIKHTPQLQGYVDIEKGIKKVIFEKYKVPEEEYRTVKDADQLLVHWEAFQLYRNRPPWVEYRKVDQVIKILDVVPLLATDPASERQKFLDIMLETM